ncbi:hypothetical protein C0992_011951 [Termitomyces sp. T32_za158]|nr:hypothetical protein C0992_011951 [Termitomyces sp. T32_za158]
MQGHERPTYDDDAEFFNFLQVAFDPVTPENHELSPLLATPISRPPVYDTTRIQSSGFSTYEVEVEGVLETPGAPMVKDLDSFTDGTGAGSFADFVDENDANELALGTLVAHPEPRNPNTSIIAWLEDVRITRQFSDPIAESNAPWVSYADLPEDPRQTEALERTGALLEDFSIDGDDEDSGDMDSDNNGDGDVNISLNVGGSAGSRIPSPSKLVSSISTPLAALTPRAMKRARSRSLTSQTSRHVRSRSLSSIHGLPHGLVALPPWRLKDKK